MPHLKRLDIRIFRLFRKMTAPHDE
jgi:hypothetical protein